MNTNGFIVQKVYILSRLDSGCVPVVIANFPVDTDRDD